MRYRIVALADSLAMPRPVKENQIRVRWEDTWPRRLEAILRSRNPRYEVVSFGKRSRTVTDLELRETVTFMEPDIVVLQVGIVDCAPRVFSMREHFVVGLLPERIRNYLIQHRSARRAQLTSKNPLKKVYVQPRVYRQAMLELQDFLNRKEIKIIVVPILVHSSLSEKAPGYISNAALYNGILNDVWGDALISPSEIVGDEDMVFNTDGQHLTPFGNDSLSRVVSRRVLKLYDSIS
jgi:hypothetical protein